MEEKNRYDDVARDVPVVQFEARNVGKQSPELRAVLDDLLREYTAAARRDEESAAEGRRLHRFYCAQRGRNRDQPGSTQT